MNKQHFEFDLGFSHFIKSSNMYRNSLFVFLLNRGFDVHILTATVLLGKELFRFTVSVWLFDSPS